MAGRPPTGYLEIVEAERKRDLQLYNIIGICIDYLPPAQSRGTDLTMKMQLWDTSCTKSSDLNSDGMLVRCFSKDNDSFPLVQEVGDVVIARSIKTGSKGSQSFGITNYGTTWSVISYSNLLDNNDPQFVGIEVRSSRVQGKTEVPRPSIAELRYAKSLVDARDPSTLHGPPKSTALDVATIMTDNGGMPPPVRKKHRTIKEITSPYQAAASQFIDLVGEVRRVYGGNVNPIEIQLTDYTEHPLLFDYAEPDGNSMQNNSWGGPWGKMTMTVNAWDQHGQYIVDKVRNNEIEMGTYLRLCNVHIKMDKLGTMMQGNLRGGNSNSGTSITIHSSKDAEHLPELKSLIARKRAYNVDRKSKTIGFVQDTSSKKRHREDEQQKIEEQQEPKKSKSAKRKQNKPRHGKFSTDGQTKSNSNSIESGSTGQSNQHVRCEAINISLTTITSILGGEFLDGQTTPAGNSFRLPFQNCKYKSKVQVVDFFPDNLEDFATPYRVSDYNALSDYESADDEEAPLDYARQKTEVVRWKWHFFVMVTDPTISKKSRQEDAVMLLQVASQDGDYLLNMEACDLRDQPQKLAKLREKLFVLWGDLEEKKIEHSKSGLQLMDDNITVSSKPFECLIREYGVKAVTEDGEKCDARWERMFGILGTNIG